MPLTEPLIPQYSNTGVQNFMAGFNMIANNNLKNQYEQLKAQTLVQNSILKQQALENQKEHNDNTFQFQQGKLELGRERLNNQATLSQIDQQQTKASDDRLTEFAGKAFTLPSKPGTQDFDTDFNVLRSQYADLAGTAEFKRIVGQVEANHVAAAKQSTQAKTNLQLDYNRAITGIGTNAGLPPQLVNNYFANPNMWNLKGGKAYIDLDANGSPVAQDDPQYKDKRKSSFTIDRPVYEGIMKKRDAAYQASQVQNAPAMKIDEETGQKIADQISANHPDWTPAQKRAEWNRQTSGYSQ